MNKNLKYFLSMYQKYVTQIFKIKTQDAKMKRMFILFIFRDWCISRQLWWGHQIPAFKVYNSANPEVSIYC